VWDVFANARGFSNPASCGTGRLTITSNPKKAAMDDKKFLALLEEAVRAAPASIRMTDSLRDMEGWDSMGGLAAIALFDEHFGVTLNADAVAACETVSNLAALVEKG
jgi:acyl carrier protein